MRVDAEATKRMWKQTVWATVAGMLIVFGLILYFFAESPTDYQSIRFLLFVFLLMPVGLGVCYLIRRFIEVLGG